MKTKKLRIKKPGVFRMAISESITAYFKAKTICVKKKEEDGSGSYTFTRDEWQRIIKILNEVL